MSKRLTINNYIYYLNFAEKKSNIAEVNYYMNIYRLGIKNNKNIRKYYNCYNTNCFKKLDKKQSTIFFGDILELRKTELKKERRNIANRIVSTEGFKNIENCIMANCFDNFVKHYKNIDYIFSKCIVFNEQYTNKLNIFLSKLKKLEITDKLLNKFCCDKTEFKKIVKSSIKHLEKTIKNIIDIKKWLIIYEKYKKDKEKKFNDLIKNHPRDYIKEKLVFDFVHFNLYK